MPTPRSARRVLVAKGHRLTASNRRTRCRSSDSRTKGDTSISPEVLDHHQIASILNQLLDRDGVSEDIHLFNEKLREWEDYYNYHRPKWRPGRPTAVRAPAGKNERGPVTEGLRTYSHPCDRNGPRSSGGAARNRTGDGGFADRAENTDVADSSCFLVGPIPSCSLVFGRCGSQVVPKPVLLRSALDSHVLLIRSNNSAVRFGPFSSLRRCKPVVRRGGFKSGA